MGDEQQVYFFGRKDFGSGFIFGVGASAYQNEGAYQEDGKGLSIWDTFSHTKGKIIDGKTGDVANDQYHRFKEDVKLLVNMGIDSYRLSISWPRIFPKGRGAINHKGVAFYNDCINELLANRIKPFLTLFHWDLPQALQDEYGGFLSRKIVDDYTAYANTCFSLFGDRVKLWSTINEPQVFCNNGYHRGTHAPGHCSNTEPYIVGHNILLSHASAVNTYRVRYQKIQNGIIGITLNTFWYVPYSNSPLDEIASRRGLDFQFGWFMEPVTTGDYPNSMRALLGDRLPKFTWAESQMMKASSVDFLGLNYYTAVYAKDGGVDDSKVTTSFDINGMLIGPQGGSHWLHVYPRGIRALLKHIKEKYNNTPVYILENGMDERSNPTLSLEESLNDAWRTDYYCRHFFNVLCAKRNDGCDVRGYYAWSFLDNFEWANGYTCRFGLYFVDRTDCKLTRHPKKSVDWLKKFLQN